MLLGLYVEVKMLSRFLNTTEYPSDVHIGSDTWLGTLLKPTER